MSKYSKIGSVLPLKSHFGFPTIMGEYIIYGISSYGADSLNDDRKTSSRRETAWELSIKGMGSSGVNSTRVSIIPHDLVWGIERLPGGAMYDGQWNEIGLAGVGSYVFPHGVEFAGGMSDSRFHGLGALNYPDGIRVEGKWVNGKLTERQLIFGDGLIYSEKDWGYAQQPDRRFCHEMSVGLKPAGCSILTDKNPTRKIPAGYYDTEDGFYDPVRNVVVDANDLREVLRVPKDPEWIKSHCRKAWDEPVGPRPDLYENWMQCKGHDENKSVKDSPEEK